MPSFDHDTETLGSSSQYLSATLSPRKSPSRQAISSRRSSSSLRGSANSPHVIDDDATNGRHSLAHELAVALMPEPTSGSRLLAEEFGIEFDEGAEGIDDEIDGGHGDLRIVVDDHPAPLDNIHDFDETSFSDTRFQEPSSGFSLESEFYSNDSITPSAPNELPKQPEDPMHLLAQSLESTDRFISHLRRLDVDTGGPSQQPALEVFATDVIRRINDSVRDREGQVRELLEYEREFRKIGGEVGGAEVLGQLDDFGELGGLEPDDGRPQMSTHTRTTSTDEPRLRRSNTQDWEFDSEHPRLGDEVDLAEAETPVRDTFPAPPSIGGPSTPARILPQLTELRTFTSSLASTLTVVSEQAQVNGAATTEAGRKIRALKNKLTGWQTDLDSAEASRSKIEKWEAGLLEDDTSSPSRIPGSRRVDGRDIVAEHLHLFELVLAEAAQKTQAIMAA
ncbi:hypothetical protein HGRIS_004626 [Hohenbuehelia grisea]|uniref:Uncharacterized protein n=1 Tax=Hohenbuehelia grisea TaxID=104357 RepID=A0ABR3JD36_9AGAR